MWKIIGGAVLLFLSLFMLLGFFNASKEMPFLARALTFLILVVFPGIAGTTLLFRHFQEKGSAKRRGERLRRPTQHAEILRVAEKRGGAVTIAAVVADTAMDPDTVKDTLMSLVTQGFADFDLTESGEIVYSFYDMSRPIDDRV